MGLACNTRPQCASRLNPLSRGYLQHLDPAFYHRQRHRLAGGARERSLAGPLLAAAPTDAFPFVSPDRPDGEAPHFVAEVFFATQASRAGLACSSCLHAYSTQAAYSGRLDRCSTCRRVHIAAAAWPLQHPPPRPTHPTHIRPVPVPQRMVRVGLLPAVYRYQALAKTLRQGSGEEEDDDTPLEDRA